MVKTVNLRHEVQGEQWRQQIKFKWIFKKGWKTGIQKHAGKTLTHIEKI